MIDLRVLGALDVNVTRSDGTPRGVTQPKRLALLLHLVLAQPTGLHARDRLLALLWPDADEASARHSLRNALHALRAALGEDVIVSRGEAFVGLDFDRVRCDALELRAHLAAGRVDEAVALWSGELAPGFHVAGAPEFMQWLDAQRAELRQAVRAAAWRRARDVAGRGHEEIEALRRALRLDPGDERGARRLMQLLAAEGDRAGALLAYQQLVDWFARELETEPSAETRAVAAGLRASGPDVAPVALPPSADRPAPAAAHAPMSDKPRGWRPAVLVAVLTALVLGGWAVVARGAAHQPIATEESDAVRAALRLPARWRADTSAYASYLRGLTLRFQYRFAESRDTMAALMDRAPLYVPGLSGLAHAWIFIALNDLADPDEAWDKADALAHRAVALDSTTANAWLALASEDMLRRLDATRAGERILHARALDPADPEVAALRSAWHRLNGNMDSAVAEARLARRLDPVSIFFARFLGRQLFLARRYAEAQQLYARIYEESPGWKRGFKDMAELSRAMGRPREAVDWLRRDRAASGDTAGAALLPPASSDSMAERLLRDDARRAIAALERARQAGRRVSASDFARKYAVLHDADATLRELDSMLLRRDAYLQYVRLDPAFDFLRHDPRYVAWEARSALPPMAASHGAD